MRVFLWEHLPPPPGLWVYLRTHLPKSWEILGPSQLKLLVPVALDPSRQQVNALRLLESLPQPRPGEAALCLTPLDLFLPAFTFVFGASLLGERRSVLSYARLRPQPPNADVFHRRVLVEALHELGHGLGLTHCLQAACPMHQSFHPEAVDLKDTDYCPLCLEKLTSHLYRTR